MSREHEAVILSFDTILKVLRETLPEEKIDREEVKILQEKDKRRKENGTHSK